MPVVGFVDAYGQPIPFDEMRKGAGNFGPVPRALLRALSRQYREGDHYGADDVISVTTLLNPIQQTRLLQRHEVYVDPLRNLWAAYGTIAHGMFEAGVEGGDIAEQKLVIEIDGVKIGGTFDLLERAGEVYAGKDYKITSAYSVQKMLAGEVRWNGDKADYFWQAQTYKYMVTHPEAQCVIEKPVVSEALHGRVRKEKELVPWEHAGQVDVDSWELVTIARDWNQREHGNVLPSPINVVPIEPLLENERIENFLRQRLVLYKASEMCEDDELPTCSSKDTWGGKRCANYCDASHVCLQFQSRLARRRAA